MDDDCSWSRENGIIVRSMWHVTIQVRRRFLRPFCGIRVGATWAKIVESPEMWNIVWARVMWVTSDFYAAGRGHEVSKLFLVLQQPPSQVSFWLKKSVAQTPKCFWPNKAEFLFKKWTRPIPKIFLLRARAPKVFRFLFRAKSNYMVRGGAAKCKNNLGSTSRSLKYFAHAAAESQNLVHSTTPSP